MTVDDDAIVVACAGEGLSYRDLAAIVGLPVWPLGDETGGRNQLARLVKDGRLCRGRRRETRSMQGHPHQQLVFFWRTR
jgi:hypothetical protein